MADIGEQESDHLTRMISKVLNDVMASSATHSRKLREISSARSSIPPHDFSSAFFESITPLFQFHRRTDAAERTVRFVSIFACVRDAANTAACDDFLENFLRFLLNASAAANKTARFRACQIISEIIMQLPDDAEVSNELWDEVIECMKMRVDDKIPIIRTFAVRALSRFANDSINCDILELFLEALSLEQSADVRKTLVLSLPPSKVTSEAVIDSTADVSELVRKAAYRVLSSKFPLQSLSIKHRTTILQRGLTDRSKPVTRECLRLLKDEWLARCCNGDLIELLRFLDVETYESVGELVMDALLKSGSIKVQGGQSIQEFIKASPDGGQGESDGRNVQWMEPEGALYWRIVCKHLQAEAEAKGSNAAGAMGTESAVYAAEATDTNDLLERVLPATVSDYIELVKAHLVAGPSNRFASRQLLLLGAMLDFSDSMNRKVASAFVQQLLHRPPEHEEDDGHIVIVGDGLNLGGDKYWANAVADLAKKVHAAAGEFEEVVLAVVGDLAQPCRERTAEFMQWMHCLAITGLLLGNVRSYSGLQGKNIEPAELLQTLLLPGAKHAQLDVQRAAIRCLGLFGLLERKPSEELVKQLRLSFERGPSPVSVMACKALVDLGMWHGPQALDRAMGQQLPVDSGDAAGDLNAGLLDLLFAVLDKKPREEAAEIFENEVVQEVIAEGFAKILLLSPNYLSMQSSFHSLVLAKLVCLYFDNEIKDLQRLKQCLSVFFEHYPSLSTNHKKCLSEAFILVMRSMWPGINGDTGGSSFAVSTMRKRAVQASRFMVQMMQAPLYEKVAEAENGSKELPETPDRTVLRSVESGEEGLAIRIAAEVANLPLKKTHAEKAYGLALCKALVLFRFRLSEPGPIKLLRRLLSRAVESVSAEKETVKELRNMDERLRAADSQPDVELSADQANLILGRLGIAFSLETEGYGEIAPTPAPTSTRPARSRRRRVKREESSFSGEEPEPPSSVAPGVASAAGRSQRASKTAAMSKITAGKGGVRISSDGSSEDTSEEGGVESDVSS